ncbi:hypothetical protein BGX28_010155 [Mortierella sp. GBA30]|nr:hypothetical protein BGX28_010155 [Mortierella sp. GBA30]
MFNGMSSGMGMNTSSPSTIISHSTLSPTLSYTTTNTAYTESTFASETSSITLRTDSTGHTTGSSSSHNSRYTTSSSRTASTNVATSPSGTTSSDTSTLCHINEAPPQSRSVANLRSYITRAQDMAMTASTTAGAAASEAITRAHQFILGNKSVPWPRPKIPSSSNNNNNNNTIPSPSPIEEPRRLTLKELSGKETRYYSKHSIPPSSFTTTTSKPAMQYLPGIAGKSGRKRPKKPDEKAFFSNERTYMHWIKFGLLLGSMALTLLGFGKEVGLNVGLFLVTVAMLTLVYATATYHLRYRWMKQARFDVRYYDRIGPTILFMALFLAYATNVALTVHKLVDTEDEGLNFYNHEPMDV